MSKRVLSFLLTTLGLSGCQLIQDQLDGNQPPVLSDFVAEPAEGQAPLLVGFSWSAVDSEGDALTCTLDFDDGVTDKIENCGQVANHFHEYTRLGGYVTVLNVSDGTTTVSKSVAVRVIEAETKKEAR